MSKYCGVKNTVVSRILKDNGWTQIRHSGSHEIWAKGVERISIPHRPDGVNHMLIRREFKTHNVWPIPK